MEKIFEILTSLKRVEAPDYLYKKILKKIEDNKNLFVKILWVRVAALLIVSLIASEIYLLRGSFQSEEEKYIQSLIATHNNMLYNE
jgi:hypothetical protein